MVKLDDVDKQIISILRKNGRRSYKKIGDDIGYSLMGTKRRFLKLVDEEIIKVTANVNINKLGYKLALTLLEVENQTQLNKILEKFKKCPRAVMVFTMLAGYNLAVITVAEDQKTLESESCKTLRVLSNRGNTLFVVFTSSRRVDARRIR